MEILERLIWFIGAIGIWILGFLAFILVVWLALELTNRVFSVLPDSLKKIAALTMAIISLPLVILLVIIFIINSTLDLVYSILFMLSMTVLINGLQKTYDEFFRNRTPKKSNN